MKDIHSSRIFFSLLTLKMKRTTLLLTGLLILNSLMADLPFRNQRRDMFRTLPVNNQSIVFMGNSITQGNEWSETYSNDPHVINRGISGNTSSEILNNLDYVLGGKPAKIFLMIGINDGADPDIVVPAIRKTIELTQKESPLTEIYIQSILPYGGRTNVLITNNLLKTLCTEKGVTYVDVYTRLGGTDTNLSLSSADSNDGLHLLGSGYRKWVSGTASLTGIEPILPVAANSTIPSAHANYVNQRVSAFALMPVSENDILMLGDFHVNTAEWRELLRNPRVKNRGIGVGHGGSSLSLPELKEMIPYVVKNNPAKVFISCGYKDLEYNGKTVEQALASYNEVIAAIRSASPSTSIYIQSLVPSPNATTNSTKYVSFNTEIQKLTNSETGIYFVDVYSALQSNGVLNTSYAWSNGGLNGRGYLKWAELLAPLVDPTIKPVSLAAYDLQIAVADARKLLYGMKAENTAGSYPAATITAFQTAIDNATTEAFNTEATETSLANALAYLNTALSAVQQSAMTLPLLSNSTNEYWYKLSAPLRSTKFVTGTGAGLISTTENNYKPQQWKFTLRSDNSWNIVNRADGSFINPAAANNTQIYTSANEPATGWTLKPAAGFSRFIITSSTSQLNLTNFSNNMIYNWGGGNNTSDEGCQFLLTEVTIQPDEEPVISAPKAFLSLFDIVSSGSAPVAVNQTDAAKVFDRDTLTVAIDFTPSVTTGDAILVASSNTTVANKFFGIGTISNFSKTGVRYVGDNNLEGWYTNSYSSATSRHRLVITMSPGTSNYNYYIDETFLRNVSGTGAYGFYTFGKIPDATLYLGGVVSLNAPNRYPFTGTIHSVHFFDGVLTADQIKKIDYAAPQTSVYNLKQQSSSDLPFAIQNKTIVPKTDIPLSIYDISGRKAGNNLISGGFYIVVAGGNSYKVIL